MKTTKQVYEQNERISNLLFANTKAAINRAHPDTGGNMLLAHNWGNEEAKIILERHHSRQSLIYRIYNELYKAAFAIEYPDHLSVKGIINRLRERYKSWNKKELTEAHKKQSTNPR